MRSCPARRRIQPAKSPCGQTTRSHVTGKLSYSPTTASTTRSYARTRSVAQLLALAARAAGQERICDG
eukprot:6095353-Prymnesium_polylepis.1